MTRALVHQGPMLAPSSRSARASGRIRLHAQVLDNRRRPARSTTPSNVATHPAAARPDRAPRDRPHTGRRSRTVSVHHGYDNARAEEQLLQLGARTVVIGRKGRPGFGPPDPRTPDRLPTDREVAHRSRSPDSPASNDSRSSGDRYRSTVRHDRRRVSTAAVLDLPAGGRTGPSDGPQVGLELHPGPVIKPAT
jgi:hypothetical protein